MAIELVPLCTMHIQLKTPIEVGVGCAGRRSIIEIESAKVDGGRLHAEMVGTACADWFLIGPDGTGTIDVRWALRTFDGAIIFLQYHGRVAGDLSEGAQLPVTVYVAPRFETSDERYTWLSRIQAIGKGTIHEDLTLDYEWYEVR